MNEQLELDLDLGDGFTPTPLFPEVTADILNEVWMERVRQDEKWGLQDHPYFSGPEPRHGMFTDLATLQKDLNNAWVKRDLLGWDTILLEELYEALEKAGIDDEAYEHELVQVAAVAVAMIEANRRERGLHD